MALEDVFPDSPCSTTLRYAVHTKAPVVIPWTKAPMKIGRSLFSPLDKGKAIFGNQGEGAFDHQDLSSTAVVFNVGSSGGHIETTASSSSNSVDKVHADISAQIGRGLFGGSRRGQNDSSAAKSAGAIQSSTRIYYYCCRISLLTFPRLSEKALRILRTAKEPAKSFSESFGHYFVAGYLLGGVNMSMFSGASTAESSFKRLNVDAEVHLAFMSRTDNIHKESSMLAQQAVGILINHDSFTDQHSEQPISDIDRAIALWEENKAHIMKLQSQVATELSKLNLHSNGTTIIQMKCDELCRSGLVLELLMLPWTGGPERLNKRYFSAQGPTSRLTGVAVVRSLQARADYHIRLANSLAILVAHAILTDAAADLWSINGISLLIYSCSS